MYYNTYNTLSTPLTLAGTQFIHVFYFFRLFRHACNESIILCALYFQLLQYTQYYSISISFLSFAKEFGHPNATEIVEQLETQVVAMQFSLLQ